MIKGQKVKCVASSSSEFTVGDIYSVIAGVGDCDPTFGGDVIGNGMVLTADDGELEYCIYPECAFGAWQLVE